MSKKILIIEDSPATASLLKSAFDKEGYEALTAKNGKEGLEKESNEKPGVVIIDTLLPDINGFEVCRKIKESRGKAAPKVIVMTGNVDAIDAVKARSAGADDYLAKTSDLSPLVDAVKGLISKEK